MSRIEHLSEGVTLYLGDCREILPTLANGAADLISDPPYGIAHVKGTGGHGKHTRRNIAPIAGDAEPFDPAHLLRFDNVLIWGADHYCARLPADMGRWLAWNKLAHLQQYDSFSDVEFAWHSRKGACRIFNYLWKGIASVKAGEDEGRRDHPTQKPIGLMRWCIEQARTPPCGTVLDPYMGSGTTGVAAAQTGRKFIGIELEQGYFDVACRRIAKVLAQPQMFIEPVPVAPPKQETFL